jgi:DHA2 family multidrug resistance protein
VNGKAPDQPLQGIRLGVVAIALALGTLMQVLDTTIANVSLTTISGNLGVSADSSTWIITAFGAANGISVPLSGWLMRRFGLVRTFVASVTLFTLSSFLCGIAWSLPSLIVFRLLQGGVSGPMIPGSQALLMSIFPESRRSLALGIWSMTTLSGPVAGPILGGYISDNFHWGWIFLINVPVGFLSAAIAWRFLRHRDRTPERLDIDKVGIVLLAVWVGSLQIFLDLGKNADWLSSPRIVVLALLAGVGFVAWLIWEVTEENPAVDLSLFRRRNFALGTTAFCFGYALFFANNLLLPLWLQKGLGYTATWAGLVSAPSGVMAIALTPFLTRIAGKVDARLLATVAFASFGTSYYMRSAFAPDTDFVHFVLPLLVQGLGMSIFFTAMMTVSLDGIGPDKLPTAIGLSNFARITSGSFAASLVTTAWDQREALHQSRLSEVATPLSLAFNAQIRNLVGLGFSERQATGLMSDQVVKQAYVLASTDLFWVSSLGSFVMIALVWLARRPANSSTLAAGD